MKRIAPESDKRIFDLGLPVLGICYGMHFMVDTLGGNVKQGPQSVSMDSLNLISKRSDTLLSSIPDQSQVWMSHGDSISKLPNGFTITAVTDNTPVAAMAE